MVCCLLNCSGRGKSCLSPALCPLLAEWLGGDQAFTAPPDTFPVSQIQVLRGLQLDKRSEDSGPKNVFFQNAPWPQALSCDKMLPF